MGYNYTVGLADSLATSPKTWQFSLTIVAVVQAFAFNQDAFFDGSYGLLFYRERFKEVVR